MSLLTGTSRRLTASSFEIAEDAAANGVVRLRLEIADGQSGEQLGIPLELNGSELDHFLASLRQAAAAVSELRPE